ncbi:hypothetical protein QE152_g14320 [Popillia japonica]|uniref:Retrotransposon gag domain-containing protein n=1 Tax=Popillia japonica TaxID=7064 RepID=A0AAW1L9E7_POPJA
MKSIHILQKKDEKTQCAQLLHYIGDDGFKIYTTFKLVEGQQNKLRDLLQKFEEHFIGKENVAYERYKFFTYRQEEGESLEDFIIELKKKANRCKLEGLQDSLIVTMITCGIRNEAIRQRLLEDDTLTLEKVIESAKVRSQAMGQGNTRKAEIDMVHKKTGHNSTKNIIKNCSKKVLDLAKKHNVKFNLQKYKSIGDKPSAIDCDKKEKHNNRNRQPELHSIKQIKCHRLQQ